MTPQQIYNQLRDIAARDDFVACTYELTGEWKAAGVGLESIDPILRFMEDYPDTDFGIPGPLVDFLESFRANEYIEKLLESLKRKPIMHTVGMLNRFVHYAKPELRRKYLAALEQVSKNENADPLTREIACDHLRWHETHRLAPRPGKRKGRR
jgi:hypothetical protein